jgi:multidrug/hemolysin transport system ATP-binding protein
VAYDTPEKLKAKYSSDTLNLVPRDMDAMYQLLQQKGYSLIRNTNTLKIVVKNSLEAYRLLKEIEGKFEAFEVIRGSMDTLYINITGHAIREED